MSHNLQLLRGYLLIACSLVCITLFAQRKISGTVVDEKKQPIIGVNILAESNSNIGTITDVDGNFTLELPNAEKAILLSFIGYTNQRVVLGNQAVYGITLKENTTQLDEVVVIGYGEVKKKDYIGSVGALTAKDISNQSITTYGQALAGQIANVQVRQGTGIPGGGPEFVVRGINSISPQAAPLIVIDEIPFGNYSAERDNFLTMLNPDDIESISVIKDASGKAIYGSRASNGLVIIKTKRGRKGDTQIEYSTNVNLQTIPSWEKPTSLTATELAQFHQERFRDEFLLTNKREPIPDEIPVHVRNPASYGVGTDWFGALTQNALMHNHNLGVRGGSDNITYNVSLGYLNQKGVVIESDLLRYSMRANIDAKIKKWLNFSMDLAPSWTTNNTGNTDPGSGQFSVYNVLNVARWADPTGKIYDAEGKLTRDTRGDLIQFYQVNPVRFLVEQKNLKENRSLQGSMGLSTTLFDGLRLKTKLSTFYINNKGRQFEPSSINAGGLEPAFNNVQASVNVGRYENLRLIAEHQLLYNKLFKKSHSVDLFLGYTGEFTQETTLGSNASRVLDENFTLLFSGNVPTFDPNDPDKKTQIFFTTSEGVTEQSLISYIGRLQYNFKEKYYLTGSIRRDGSSRFGPGNRWGVFPSGALAYRITKEKWFPKNDIITDARFEISGGVSGNNRIGNYQWRGGVGSTDYVIGGAKLEGYSINALPNPFLKWEETNQLDIGLDLGLFKDKLNLEIDYYVSKTNDLLFSTTIPAVTGFGNRISNLGDIENRGYEFTTSYQAFVSKNFSWNIKANIGVNRNKVLKIGEYDRPILSIPAGNGTNAGITQVGGPIGMFRGLKVLGLYTQQMIDDPSVPKYAGAVVGAPFFEDFDKNGVLDRNLDIQIVGNPWPDFTYGMTNTFIYKGFNLRIITLGEQGSSILDLTREFMQNTDRGSGNYLGVFNLDKQVLDRWRPGDTDFGIRPPTTVNAASSQRWRWPGSAGVIDGSFFKIGNITLTYSLGKLLKNIKGIRNVNAGVTVQNVHYFKHFYANPEARRAAGGLLERNVYYSGYPVPRTYSLNFSVSL